ncbi:MAG: hypothetical protein ABJA70_19325 [Chryseolinea sp.]
MNKRTFVLLSTSCLLLFFVSAKGQDTLRVTAAAKANAMASRFQSELGLTKSQVDQVNTILVERFNSIQNSSATKSSAIASANTVAKQELTSVLTPKQLSTYQELRADLRKQKDAYAKKNPSYKPTDIELELDF